MKALDLSLNAASALLLFAASIAQGATLIGSVNDLGATKPKDGIAGVRVVVKNLKGQQLGEGLTDANGTYKIEIAAESERATAYFEKLGFQSRPTVRAITSSETEQKPVYMVRESAGQDYYRSVASAMAQTAALPVEERRSRAILVAALPAPDKLYVTDELKKRAATTVLADIRVGEESQRAISNVRSQLIADPSLGVRPIWVVPDYKSPGNIHLYGSVRMAHDKVRVEEIAKGTPGIKGVQNRLMIAK